MIITNDIEKMTDNEVLEKFKWLNIHPEIQRYIDIWLREIAIRLYLKDREIKKYKELLKEN